MPIRLLRLARELFNPKPLPPENVISGRIEIERHGRLAYLEYTLAGNVLALIHTEIPKDLKHTGLASALAERALHWPAKRDTRSMSSVLSSTNTSASTPSTPIW